MTRRLGVFACVTITGSVATQRYAALLTRSEMNPRVADFYTLHAFANFRLLHGIDGVEMTTTTIRHNYFRLLLEARRR
jgi:hypothetical protein